MNLTEGKAGGLEFLQSKDERSQYTILLFHGYGADAYDLASLSQIAEGFSWVFPQGPLAIPVAPGYMGRAWFPVDIEFLRASLKKGVLNSIYKAFPPEMTDARRKVMNLIAELNIPLSNLILGGFSQGAVLALEVALYLEEKPAGLILFSGTLINEEKWKKGLPRLQGVAFFQSHGKQDPILPYDKAQDLEQLLLQSGLKGEMLSFHGEHTIPPSVLSKAREFLSTFNAEMN